LLLDGLDEVSHANAPIWLKEQLKGWGQNLRVVVTCRINQWEATTGGNSLSDSFDVYRTLDYSYQTSQGEDQVEKFISNWFGDKEKEVAHQIRRELDAPGKERIKDLVKNPLRLTLLCASWKKDNHALPETQADLYQGFVTYLYGWKAREFQEEVKLKDELNLALGELAKAGLNRASINDGAVRRFRFTASEIRKLWQDLTDTLLSAAKSLGWLNVVGEEVKEDLYAFYHPTFQEYFAACSIDDWDYFLPRLHEDRPVPCEGELVPTYRVFEKQWQQVILLWIGRQCLINRIKDEFFLKLTEFSKNENIFYYYKSYSIIFLCISEYKKSSQNSKIISKIIDYMLVEKTDLSVPKQIAKFAISILLAKKYSADIGNSLYELLINIDNELFKLRAKDTEISSSTENIIKNQTLVLYLRDQIRVKKEKKEKIFGLLQFTRHLPIVLIEYLYNFILEDKYQSKLVLPLYNVLIKHPSIRGITKAEEIILFKESDRYKELIIEKAKVNYTNKSSPRRKYKRNLKFMPGQEEKKIKEIACALECFDNETSQYYKNNIIEFMTDEAYHEYLYYDIQGQLIDALNENQCLTEYLFELLIDNEHLSIRHKIVRILSENHLDKHKSLDIIIDLIENTNSIQKLDILLKYLCEIVAQKKELSQKAIEYLKRLPLYKNIHSTAYVDHLSKILTMDLIPSLIGDVRYYLSENSCNYQGSKSYYQLIVRCSQNLSYPEFYLAWHSEKFLDSSFSGITNSSKLL
jgi:hypothetical protein